MELKCIEPGYNLKVKKNPNEDWIYLEQAQIKGTCREVIGSTDPFLLWTYIAEYYIFSSNMHEIANYSCYRMYTSVLLRLCFVFTFYTYAINF